MKAPSRNDRSPIGRWFWSVDRAALAIISAIVIVGFVVLMAAGPATAQRLGIADSFHFPTRQLMFLLPALGILIGVSFLTPLEARRLGAVVFIAALILLAATLILAPEVNGARRWIGMPGLGLQPSELAKPGFIIVAAWMLAEGARNPKFPGAAIAAGLYGLLTLLLVLQPDYGQASLVAAVWMTMFFIVGWNWKWIAALGGAAFVALLGGYFFSPHLARRIDGFLNPGAVEDYQTAKSLEAIAHGGVFGRGGEGASVKMQLPDAHADYIFAVAGEEGGFVLAFAILALFAALTVRLFVKATSLKSLFAQCAVGGLAASIGLQSFINMGVALRALPAKGMTLPFVSYGGSSLLATGLTLGLVMALTRAPAPARRRREFMP
jgi:cell division protein FtsW